MPTTIPATARSRRAATNRPPQHNTPAHLSDLCPPERPAAYPREPSYQSPRSSAEPAQGFSPKELGHLSRVDQRLEAAYSAQEGTRSRLSMLYAQLSTFAPFPVREVAMKALRLIGQALGFGSASERAEHEAVQRAISSRVKAVKEIHTRFIRDEERAVRRQFRGRTFVANPQTPKVLTQVAIPEGKAFVSFTKLRSLINQEMGDLGSRIRMICPSSERIILYRQRPNKSWDSLELAWRRPGKVDVVRNGVELGNLFNDDALLAAKAFAQGKCFSLKERVQPADAVWKVA